MLTLDDKGRASDGSEWVRKADIEFHAGQALYWKTKAIELKAYKQGIRVGLVSGGCIVVGVSLLLRWVLS